jgi:hypothetical protein
LVAVFFLGVFFAFFLDFTGISPYWLWAARLKPCPSRAISTPAARLPGFALRTGKGRLSPHFLSDDG